MEAFIFTSGSPWGQGQVKGRSNKVKSPNTKFSFWIMSILSSFASGFQKWQLFWCTTITNAQKIHFKNIKNFVTALFQNPWAQVKFFLTARCAVDTESSDVETTSIASVVFPLLISATFRAVLNQCALAPSAPTRRRSQRTWFTRVRTTTTSSFRPSADSVYQLLLWKRCPVLKKRTAKRAKSYFS